MRTRAFVSIRVKLALATLIVLAEVTAGLYISVSHFAWRGMIDAKELAARMAGGLFLRAAATPVIFDDATGVADTVSRLAADPDVLSVAIWRAAAGRVSAAPLAAQRLPGAGGVAPRWVTDLAVEEAAGRLVLRGPVRDQDGQIIAVAAVQVSLSREEARYKALRRSLVLGAAGAAALLAAMLSIMARRWITGPLSRLGHAVAQVEAGGRAELGRTWQRDEIGGLAAAFSRMATAVHERERALTRRNDDMQRIMDSVAQGLLSVTRDGRLLPEHSAAVTAWFGPWPGGGTFADYVAAMAPQAGEWLAVAWENVSADVLPLELALEQLPARVEAGGRTLALSYRPIVRGEEVSVLIVVSDMTLEIAQERAQAEQQELVHMFLWLGRDRAGLLEFFAESDRLLAEITDGDSDPVTLRRQVHTLKGNCGVFGLGSVAAACQAVEDHLAEAPRLTDEDRAALQAAWQRAADRLCQLVPAEPDRPLRITHAEHRALLDALERGAPRAEIAAMARRWLMEPARQRLERLGEQARGLARRLGKGEIAVTVADHGLRFPAGFLAEFWSAFAHVLRNAVDHGLETPAERQAAGKDAAGHLWLRTRLEEGRLVIELEDDGRGIDWERLRQRARTAGLPAATPQELEAALFADGVSTRDTISEVSGRGVGMGAVRQACEQSGGTVSVHSGPGRGTRFCFTWPLSMLAMAAAPALASAHAA